MLRSAFSELRHHPGRLAATLTAIIISISFVAGSLIYTTTVRESTSRATSLHLSHADVVIQGQITPELLSAVRTQVGVEAAEYSARTGISLASSTKAGVFDRFYAPGSALAWSGIIMGRWPNTAGEIALSRAAAEELKVKVSDTLTADHDRRYTVVGLTDDQKLPTSLLDAVYISPTDSEPKHTIVVAAARDADLKSLVNRLQSVAASADSGIQVKLGAAVRDAELTSTTNSVDVLRYVLLVFGAIALIVGMIIIANTFNILLAQRRQQIGLLRAVGATTGQVRRRLLAEAAILGLVGSIIGIWLGAGFAALGVWLTSTLAWGIFLPWFELILTLAGGVLITAGAALVPSLRATKVSPMEALRVVPSESRSKQVTVVRYLVCGVMAAFGVVLSYLSVSTTKLPLGWAIGAGGFIVFAVIGLSPVFVPGLIAGLGRVFSSTGPTLRMATANGVRNPSRSAATVTALMLVVGLVVSLQVALASTRVTATRAAVNRYPVPLVLSSQSDAEEISDSTAAEATAVPGVAWGARVAGGVLQDGSSSNGSRWFMAIAPGDLMKTIAPESVQTPPTNTQAYVDPSEVPKGYDGTPVEVSGPAGSVSLTLVPSRFVEPSTVLVSPDNLTKLVPRVTYPMMWLSLSPEASLSTVLERVKAVETRGNVRLSGSAPAKYAIDQMIGVLLAAISAMLGVSVLIALIGVTNTLWLSVIERRRESALLRALGMQRSELRLMLLFEALLIAGVGTIIGLISGGFFGWLGTRAAFAMMPSTANQPLVYAIDWFHTAVLLIVVFLSAGLASVLPGRRAANTTPTEALADE